MENLILPSNARMPKYGMGTWHMGEQPDQRPHEVSALRAGMDAGARLIDTAEMYANGGAEEVVGEAIAGRRDEIFLISKVLPSNASYARVMGACEQSLSRLSTDRLDLYLYHWRGGTPLEETFRALVDLQKQGKIIDFGVSNFDVDDLAEWSALDTQGLTAVNQIYFNLRVRDAEWSVIPWCLDHGIAVQTYTPIDQGGELLRNAVLNAVAERHGATPAQIALAWIYAKPGLVPLPKSSNAARARENLAATTLVLEETDLEELETAFPQPSEPVRLPML